ncbi:MAG: CSLREA domain-containing protein [Proteobacteria bacterium]|nr:MAG: CSLREA domain-containing protein [Pseudomonadota bacterium]
MSLLKRVLPLLSLTSALIMGSQAAQAATLTVNSTADTNDGVCNASNCTLREAINQANSSTGDVIEFDATAFAGTQTIYLSSSLPNITSTMTINGLPGGTPSSSRKSVVLNVFSWITILTVNSGAQLQMNGLTFQGGIVGFYNRGTTTVRYCTFSGNTNGMDNDGSTTTSDSTFSGNNYGFKNWSGSADVYNCTFANNRYYGFQVDGGSPSLRNVTITGNGLGIYDLFEIPIVNSLVVGNDYHTYSGSFYPGYYNLFTGTASAAGLDPWGLQDNGGPTQTVALTTNGTAVNGGNPSSTGVNDQRGPGFSRVKQGRIDIGAFESDLGTPPAPAPSAGSSSASS